MKAAAGPVVESAAIGPGHDGRAELVVALRHPNGATSTISLDEESLGAVLARCDVASLDDLVGRPWSELSDRSDRSDAADRSALSTAPRSTTH